MASRSAQLYPLFSWLCGNIEVDQCLPHLLVVMSTKAVSGQIQHVNTPSENDSLSSSTLSTYQPICAFCSFSKSSPKHSGVGAFLPWDPHNQNFSSNYPSSSTIPSLGHLIPCPVLNGGTRKPWSNLWCFLSNVFPGHEHSLFPKGPYLLELWS